MDIKDFIKETIGGIIDATRELQTVYEPQGVVVNPPVSVTERDLYEEGGPGHTYRRVEIVEFDVAVTASTESAGGGKAGLKILSIDAGLDGKHVRTNEQASRVKFSIPVSLSPSEAEAINKEAHDARRRQSANYSKRRRSIV